MKALCAPVLADNFGFVGNGQETSMVRSAFEKTGLIKSVEGDVDTPGTPEPGIGGVIGTIKEFIESADNAPFDGLYEELMGR